MRWCAVVVGIALVGGVTPASAQPAPPSTRAAALADIVRTDAEELAMSQAIALGEDVVVESATTETSEVVARPDGSFELTVDNSPVRVERNGEWVPIDTTLVLDATGDFYSPVATTVDVRFSAGGSDELAQVSLGDEEWLVETWPLGALPAPVLDGSSVTYVDVLPDVDLRLTATSTGMSEVLIIQTEEAALHPDLSSLEIGVEGAEVSKRHDGTYSVTPEGAAAGSSDLTAGAPIAWDSEFAQGTADGPSPEDIPIVVDADATSDGISLDIDAVTDDPDLVYPVYVDPDWTGGRVAAWSIDATYPNQTYPEGGAWSSPNQPVGYVQAAWSQDGYAHTARSFWLMDTSGVKGKIITAAHFNVTEVWSPTCTPRVVNLFHTSAATPGSTWNQSLGVTYIQLQDSKNVAHGYSAACPASVVGFNAQPAVAAAAAVNADSLTLALVADNESDTLSWKRFAFEASLVITYNTRPDVPLRPILTAPPRSCGVTESSSPYIPGVMNATFGAWLNDQDGGNLTGRFTIERKNASNVYQNALPPALAPSGYISSASQPSGFQSVVIPANTLADGQYRWSVKAADASTTSAASTTCYFKVESAPPTPPTLSTLTSGYVVGKPVTIKVSTTVADQASLFVYWWRPDGSTSPASVPVDDLVSVCDRAGVREVRYACADAGTRYITVSPVESNSTLWVATRDAAGLLSAATPAPFVVEQTAAPDVAGVSYTNGHAWLTTDVTLPAEIPDSGETDPMELSLGSNAILNQSSTIDPSVGAHAVIDFTDYLPLSEFRAGGKMVEVVGSAPVIGHSLVEVLGWMLPPSSSQPAATTNPVYRCGTAPSDYLAVTSCSGGVLLGYVWKTQADAPADSDAVELRECSGAADRFAYVFATCTTGPLSLGWVVRQAYGQTANSPVDTTESFTVSAWLKPASAVAGTGETALSQSGEGNSAYTLGRDATGRWQFCMQEPRSGRQRVCATAAEADTSTSWQFVTGVWDAANDQIRLYVGPGSIPENVTWRAPDKFSDTPATGGFTVGYALLRGAPAEPWAGWVSSPSIFPGVAEFAQRDSLFTEGPPQ